MKWTKAIVGAAVALLLLVVARERFNASDLTSKVYELEQQLEDERVRLADYVQRLSASRRVAQVTVLDQRRGEHSNPITRLRWQEIAPDGLVGEPRELEVVGRQVYFEAYVVKFDHQLVASADPDRGGSLVMFRRVFGDGQAPDSADILNPFRAIDDPVDDPSSSGAEAVWSRFWQLVDSPALAEEYGIRVAQCEAPAVRLEPGQTWEVALDAPGGLNLRRLRDPAHLARSTPD